MSRLLREAGYVRSEVESADVIIVNTCTVTEESNRKSRQLIHRLVRQNPGALLVVTGCYAQLSSGEIDKIEGVDLVLGTNKKNFIVDYLKDSAKGEKAKIFVDDILKVDDFHVAISSDDRTRTFLKIQDGCDYYCSYCTVPLARGGSRSARIADVVQCAREAGESGAKEIILTGVNIGDFGRKNGEKLLDLIVELDKIESIDRFRISSIEPNLLTDEIIDFVSRSERFMPHFHIPLQSGCDEMLRLMHRRYNTDFFAEKIATIRAKIPHAFIGIDVIVGMRGETAEYFEKSESFLRGLDYSQLHVFSYSERPNTLAVSFSPNVDVSERHRRNAVLHELSEEKRRKFYERFLGSEASVLFEFSNDKDKIYGFTENYLRVEVEYDEQLINCVRKVKLVRLSADGQTIESTLI